MTYPRGRISFRGTLAEPGSFKKMAGGRGTGYETLSSASLASPIRAFRSG